MGQLAVSEGLARMGIRCHVQRAITPNKGFLHNEFMQALNIIKCNVFVSDKKKNIPSVQVKNKPCARELKHEFILGSTVCMVTNNKTGIF